MSDKRYMLQALVPLLQVKSIDDTLAYYQQVLHFELDFAWPADAPWQWVQVSRDAIRFMFTTDLGTSSGRFIAEPGNGVVFYVMVEDIEALYGELRAAEAMIVQELRDFGGRKQFSIADPNAYVIAFSQAFR